MRTIPEIKKLINKLTSTWNLRANGLSVLANQNTRFAKAMLYNYVHEENRVFHKFWKPEYLPLEIKVSLRKTGEDGEFIFVKFYAQVLP